MKNFKYEKPLLHELILRIRFLQKEFEWRYSAWVDDNAASRNHWSLNKNPEPGTELLPEAPQITWAVAVSTITGDGKSTLLMTQFPLVQNTEKSS